MVRHFTVKVNVKDAYFPYFLLPERMAKGMATAKLRPLVTKKKIHRLEPFSPFSSCTASVGAAEGTSVSCADTKKDDKAKHTAKIKQNKRFFMRKTPGVK